MSFEVLDQLENKIKQTVETIQLLQLEVEELKEKNGRSQQENDALRSENEQLRSEHQNIQERLRSIIGMTDGI